MPSIITSAGETAIAQKQAAEENLVIATLKFFNIDVGGENPTTPDQADVEPDAQYLVHTAALTAAGFINPNSVVYSTLLDSSVGDFTFTWIGWYTAEGVLFAITHTTPQYKKQTTGEQTGNNFTRNLIFPYSGAQALTGIVVPAETWQLDFTERFETGETEQKKTNRALYGRAAFLNDAFKVTAIPPHVEDDCESVAGWTLSGGSGLVELDAAVKTEGANSLKISGQIEDAVLTKDVSTAPRDWSGKNGLIIDLIGDSATNVVFYIEDSLANRDQWNLVNQVEWTKFELKLDAPDVVGGCDYSDVCKFGLEGLDNGVIYNIDAIKTCRFNDFQIEAGEAFQEGIRLEELVSTYQGHLADYNNIGTAVDAIAPPGADTRTDNVYIDVHVQGDFNTIAPYIEIHVTDQVLADNVDDNGKQHYVEKIGEIERTISEQIIVSMLADFRQINNLDTDLGTQGKIEVLTPKYDHALGSLSQTRVGGATARWDHAAQNLKSKSSAVVPVNDGDDILIVGMDSPTDKILFDKDRLKITVSRKTEATIPLGDQGGGVPFPIFMTGNDCLCDFWVDKTFDELSSLVDEEDQRFVKNQGYGNRVWVNGLQIFRGGIPQTYESPTLLKNPYFLLNNGYSYEAIERVGVNEDMCRFLDLWRFYKGNELLEISPIHNPFGALYEKVYLDDPAGRFTRIAKGPGATADNDPNMHDRTSPSGSETVTNGNYASAGTNEISGLSAADRKKFRFGARVYDAGLGIPGPGSGTKKTTIVGAISAGSIFLFDSETGLAVNVNAVGDLTVDMGGNSGISLQEDAFQPYALRFSANALAGDTSLTSDGTHTFGGGSNNFREASPGGYYLRTDSFARVSEAPYGAPRVAKETRAKSIQSFIYTLP